MAKTKSRPPAKKGTANSDAAENQGNQPTDKLEDSRQPETSFLTPDPPKSRPILYVASGILMVGWMIFLLVVALNK